MTSPKFTVPKFVVPVGAAVAIAPLLLAGIAPTAHAMPSAKKITVTGNYHCNMQVFKSNWTSSPSANIPNLRLKKNKTYTYNIPQAATFPGGTYSVNKRKVTIKEGVLAGVVLTFVPDARKFGSFTEQAVKGKWSLIPSATKAARACGKV